MLTGSRSKLTGDFETRHWRVVITDHDPVRGGKTEVIRFGTRAEAVWYGEQEVKAGTELFPGTKFTFTVTR